MLSSLKQHKFKIGGGLVALAILVSVAGWGQWWKSKYAKAQFKIADMEARELVYQSDLRQAKIEAMTPKEVEREVKVIYIKEGEKAKATGFIATQKQVAECKACLEFKEKYRGNLVKATNARDKALNSEQVAIRSKKGWRSKAIVGTLGGIALGIILDRAIK